MNKIKFYNDPFTILTNIVNKKYLDGWFITIYFQDEYYKKNKKCYASTLFPDNTNKEAEIIIDASVPLNVATELYAHELAHIITVDKNPAIKNQSSKKQHGKEWGNVFQTLNDDFCANMKRLEEMDRNKFNKKYKNFKKNEDTGYNELFEILTKKKKEKI